MTQLPRYLTATQVAQRFEVTAETVREWARTGKLRATTLPGGRYKFRREDVEAIEQGNDAAGAA